MMHVNVNCSNYERSHSFYELLGFKVMWEVPEIAAAVGMPPYLIRGALLQLEGSPTTAAHRSARMERARDNEPPYPHLYHPGIARIALLTSDLAADVQPLKAYEVESFSEPVLLDPPDAPPARFVRFKDPDSTELGLVETEQL